MQQQTKLGILGGMRPQTTQVFYQYILDRTDAISDQQHLPTCILSDTQIPDRASAILTGQTEKLYDQLLNGVKLLKKCGCTNIAIPCNTSHYFVDQLQEETGISIIHMIRETVAVLYARGMRLPGILATDGTIRTMLYEKECAALGMRAIIPDFGTQKLIMSIIYQEIKQGKKGSYDKFSKIDHAIRKVGCDCAILASTELSVFSTYHMLSSFYLDSMAVLAERAIVSCGYAMKAMYIGDSRIMKN